MPEGRQPALLLHVTVLYGVYNFQMYPATLRMSFTSGCDYWKLGMK